MLAGDDVGEGGGGTKWEVERRFRVTEVALAILWVCGIRRLKVQGLLYVWVQGPDGSYDGKRERESKALVVKES